HGRAPFAGVGRTAVPIEREQPADAEGDVADGVAGGEECDEARGAGGGVLDVPFDEDADAAFGVGDAGGVAARPVATAVVPHELSGGEVGRVGAQPDRYLSPRAPHIRHPCKLTPVGGETVAATAAGR